MRSIVILAMLAFSFSAVGSAQETLPAQRELRCTVLDVDGEPTSGTLLYMIGLGRSNLMLLEDAKKKPDWQFRTDANGRFTVSFQVKSISAYEEGGMGTGSYSLIALPGPKDVGIISPRIINPRPDETIEPDYMEGEWGRHVILSDLPTSLNLQLRKGLPVSGTAYDMDDKPVPDMDVVLVRDAGAETHTGYGGEIWQQGAKTNEQGQFVFPRVHPGPFVLHPAFVWMQSRSNTGEWIDGGAAHDRLEAESSGANVDMKGIRNGEFIYEGTVKDEVGNPIANAEVTVAVSRHNPPQGWSDFHRFRETKTDANGRYEFRLDSPFVRFLKAKPEGYENSYIGGDEESMKRPGTYDFVLSPKVTP